jgi:hypothetical protein
MCVQFIRGANQYAANVRSGMRSRTGSPNARGTSSRSNGSRCSGRNTSIYPLPQRPVSYPAVRMGRAERPPDGRRRGHDRATDTLAAKGGPPRPERPVGRRRRTAASRSPAPGGLDGRNVVWVARAGRATPLSPGRHRFSARASPHRMARGGIARVSPTGRPAATAPRASATTGGPRPAAGPRSRAAPVPGEGGMATWLPAHMNPADPGTEPCRTLNAFELPGDIVPGKATPEPLVSTRGADEILYNLRRPCTVTSRWGHWGHNAACRGQRKRKGPQKT